MRVALVCAACPVALAGCTNRLGQDADGYRTMSCDELMEHLAAFDEKVKQAMAELASHGQSTARLQAMRPVPRQLPNLSKNVRGSRSLPIGRSRA